MPSFLIETEPPEDYMVYVVWEGTPPTMKDVNTIANSPFLDRPDKLKLWRAVMDHRLLLGRYDENWLYEMREYFSKRNIVVAGVKALPAG